MPETPAEPAPVAPDRQLEPATPQRRRTDRALTRQPGRRAA